MMMHQSCKRGAMIVEKAILDFPRFNQIATQGPGDIFAHFDIDQCKQIALGWIKHVIEIKNPVINMGKFGWHGAIA
jgi:hypothetical protein